MYVFEVFAPILQSVRVGDKKNLDGLTRIMKRGDYFTGLKQMKIAEYRAKTYEERDNVYVVTTVQNKVPIKVQLAKQYTRLRKAKK